ncbi:cobaltochelatase CobT-related protein [Massilia sp. TN1-12]|uniref:cobaltochelatase CobT-related protein n=1 Tax=Massilia paldalensis TaxID=3377675 RepID=UPI0038510940
MELLDAIQGFLDHEVAHILFTEFPLMGQAQKFGAGGMLNLIEDSRIERAMAERFQGSAENMARMGKFFLDKYTTPHMKAALESGNDEELTAVLTVPLVRMMAGQQVFAEYMRDKMHHVQELYDKIKDLQPKIAAAASTKDCLNLAKTIVKRLRDGEPAPSDEEEGSSPMPIPMPTPKGGSKAPKGKDEGEEAGGATGSPTASDDSDDDEGEKKEKAASAGGKKDERDEETDEEEAPAAGDEEGDEEAAPAPAADDEGSDEEVDPEEDPSGDLSAGAGGDEGDEGGEAGGGPMEAPNADDEVDIAKSSSLSWEAIDRETAKDYDDVASGLITDTTAKAALASDYLVYTTDDDIIEPLKVGSGYTDSMLTGLQDKVDHMIGPLQKDLERAISAKSLSHWNPGHRSGRLNAAALSRLATQDTRVFRRKVESETKDVAVELLVDFSGSMDGEKIHTATQAAYALSATLDRIGIPNEVMAFTTGAAMGGGDLNKIREEEAKIGRQYSRYEQLYMPVLKSFAERMGTETKKRFGWLPYTSSMRNNVDGECVEIAGRRLMARREKGKILIVLSDGAPHAYGYTNTLQPHLKKVVENLSRTGMKVIGIGIQSSEVKKFYPKNFVINKVDELPAVVMKELRQLIAG